MTLEPENEFQEPEEDTSYELELPFIVVTSKGGPYDDHAFVAGIRFGQIYQCLAAVRPPMHQVPVESALVAQLDLLAMHLGYNMISTAWDLHPEWSLVTFGRIGSEDDPR